MPLPGINAGGINELSVGTQNAMAQRAAARAHAQAALMGDIIKGVGEGARTGASVYDAIQRLAETHGATEERRQAHEETMHHLAAALAQQKDIAETNQSIRKQQIEESSPEHKQAVILEKNFLDSLPQWMQNDPLYRPGLEGMIRSNPTPQQKMSTEQLRNLSVAEQAAAARGYSLNPSTLGASDYEKAINTFGAVKLGLQDNPAALSIAANRIYQTPGLVPEKAPYGLGESTMAGLRGVTGRPEAMGDLYLRKQNQTAILQAIKELGNPDFTGPPQGLTPELLDYLRANVHSPVQK